jgi:hypothetical protein
MDGRVKSVSADARPFPVSIRSRSTKLEAAYAMDAGPLPQEGISLMTMVVSNKSHDFIREKRHHGSVFARGLSVIMNAMTTS